MVRAELRCKEETAAAQAMGLEVQRAARELAAARAECEGMGAAVAKLLRHHELLQSIARGGMAAAPAEPAAPAPDGGDAANRLSRLASELARAGMEVRVLTTLPHTRTERPACCGVSSASITISPCAGTACMVRWCGR